jgi:phosphatidate phosphatase PAH1
MRPLALMGFLGLFAVGCTATVASPVGLDPGEAGDLPTGRGPNAVGTAVPQVSCDGAPDVGPAGDFNHTTSEIIAALGDPQHRGLDLIATADQDPQSIEGWLAYTVADKSLEDEDVDLYACLDNSWQYLGTATTDDNGHYALQLTGDARLPLGMRDVYASVVGDRTSTQYIAYVAADDQPLIVSDVDGTLTTSEYQFIETIALGIDCTAWPGAADAHNAATSEGYQLVYLTSRGNQYTTVTRQWLAEQGFPPGPIRLSPSFITLPGNDTVDFKTSAIQGFMSGFTLTAGVGNRESDIEAYTNVGLPPADIWVKMPEYQSECQADLDAGNAFSFTDYPTFQSTFIDTLP